MDTKDAVNRDWRMQHRLCDSRGKIISGRKRFNHEEVVPEQEVDYFLKRKKQELLEAEAFEDDACNDIFFKNIRMDKPPDYQTTISKKQEKEKKWNLNNMSEDILERIVLIRSGENLYYYNGRSYKIIKNGEDLLEIVRTYVSIDAFGSTTINRFSDLFVFFKADRRLIPKDYDEKMRNAQYYIAFSNGVLDIRTLELKAHSKKYLVFYELNMEWKENAYPKRFLKFVGQISNNNEAVAKRIVEATGYLLSPVNVGKYFFVMGVAPDSGKSTMANLLQAIIGTEYIAHVSPHQMGGRFGLGDIHGKTLNFAMDLPNGKFNPIVVSIIKQITGGDVITTDQKFERMKEVHSNMRFLFSSNYPVSVPKEEDNDSFWNRMIIVPFQYSVNKEGQDNGLIDKLLKEREDIVSLCLRIFHYVLRNKCIFSECKIAEDMKEKWRNEETDIEYTLQEFLTECVEVTGNKQDSLYAMQLYDLYTEYCKKQGWNPMKYAKVMEWCEKNIPQCEKKRIHRTGTNPKAGFVGMRFLNTFVEDF